MSVFLRTFVAAKRLWAGIGRPEGLWVIGYRLWAIGYRLWAMGYGLWVMGYGLWAGIGIREEGNNI